MAYEKKPRPMERPTMRQLQDANPLFFSDNTSRFFGDCGHRILKNYETRLFQLHIRHRVTSMIPGKIYCRTTVWDIDPETLELSNPQTINEHHE